MIQHLKLQLISINILFLEGKKKQGAKRDGAACLFRRRDRAASASRLFPPHSPILLDTDIITLCIYLRRSFAHGANDVANAVGPFAGVWYVWKYGRLDAKVSGIRGDMRWILAMGGCGIVLGLATMGYQVRVGRLFFLPSKN
jgi:hypothetical protein